MTELGSDLTVSGRVRASQGSVEGDAVMLGPGSYIPGTMIKLGKGLRLDENGALSVSSPPTQLDLSDAVVTQYGTGQHMSLTGVAVPATVDGETPYAIYLEEESMEPVSDPLGLVYAKFMISALPVYPEEVLESESTVSGDHTGHWDKLFVVDSSESSLSSRVRAIVRPGGGAAELLTVSPEGVTA